MVKLLSLVLGLTLGGVVGAAVVTLLAPTSGEQFIANLKRGYAETLEAARAASAERRAQLEAELEAIWQQRQTKP